MNLYDLSLAGSLIYCRLEVWRMINQCDWLGGKSEEFHSPFLMGSEQDLCSRRIAAMGKA